jgi:hypothetical protein
MEPKCFALFLCISSDSFEAKVILHTLHTVSFCSEALFRLNGFFISFFGSVQELYKASLLLSMTLLTRDRRPLKYEELKQALEVAKSSKKERVIVSGQALLCPPNSLKSRLKSALFVSIKTPLLPMTATV